MEKTDPERFRPGIDSNQLDHLTKYISNELISLSISRLDSLLFHGETTLSNESSVVSNVQFWSCEPGQGLLTLAAHAAAEKLGEDVKNLPLIIDEFKAKTSPIKYESASIEEIKNGNEAIKAQVVANISTQLFHETKFVSQKPAKGTEKAVQKTNYTKDWTKPQVQRNSVLINTFSILNYFNNFNLIFFLN